MISSKTYACHYTVVDLTDSKLSYHSRHAPNIGTCPPFGAQDDFWRAVLSGLDIICEVVSDPASVSKICNLDRYSVHSSCYIFLACLLWRSRFVQGDTGYGLGKIFTGYFVSSVELYGRRNLHSRGLFLVFLVIVGAVGRTRICQTKHFSHRFGRCSGSYSTTY